MSQDNVIKLAQPGEFCYALTGESYQSGWRLYYETRASAPTVLVIKRLGMIRHLIERPAGW